MSCKKRTIIYESETESIIYNVYNIYDRELGMNVAHCKHGFKYLMVNRDEFIVEESQAVFLYAYDVCLIECNEQGIQRIFDSISRCISEYGMKVSGKKVKSDLYRWSEEREKVESLWK